MTERTVRLTEPEIACIKQLAEYFEHGRTLVYVDSDEEGNLDDPLRLPPDRRAGILETLQSLGVIADAVHSGHQFAYFRITAQVVQVIRAIAAEESEKPEPRNIVAEVKEKVTSNPVAAWAIIAVAVSTAVVTLVNQAMQILERLGVLPSN